MIEEVIDHDTACAQEIGKRFELGCFEEQVLFMQRVIIKTMKYIIL